MRLFLIFLLFIFASSCVLKNITYNRDKLLKKYATDYTVFLDDTIIDITNTYLDKSNIENILVNRKTKRIDISTFKETKLIAIKDLDLDSLTKNNIDLIVIDGVPFADKAKEKVKIDVNAIQYLSIIKQEKLNSMTWCSAYNGDVLLITTT